MSQPAFAKDRYELPLSVGQSVNLERPDQTSAHMVAEAMCPMDPWLTLNSKPDQMSAFLTREDAHCCRRIIRLDGAIAGVVAVRNPWLHGPYLNLLAVLPAYQRTRVGAAILGWMEREAGDAAGNLWVCATEFNTRAIAFYERYGFRRVGYLPDLVSPGFAELLLRKQLAPTRSDP